MPDPRFRGLKSLGSTRLNFFVYFVLLTFDDFAGGEESIEEKNPGTYVARLASTVLFFVYFVYFVVLLFLSNQVAGEVRAGCFVVTINHILHENGRPFFIRMIRNESGDVILQEINFHFFKPLKDSVDA